MNSHLTSQCAYHGTMFGYLGKISDAEGMPGTPIDTSNEPRTIIISNSESYLRSPIKKDAIISVPTYIVGNNSLRVFIDGCKARLNTTYVEIGQAGKQSSTIKFIDDYEEGHELFVQVRLTSRFDIGYAEDLVVNKILFEERFITGPVRENSIHEVQEYTVGSNSLDVYLNGCRCNVNEFYEEVGTIGEKSNQIKFLDPFDKNYTVCVRSTDIILKPWVSFNDSEPVITAINCNELNLATRIKAGALISVPDYVCGSFQLEVFLDGCKCDRGVFYEEVGPDGAWADQVQIIDEVPATHELTFRITSFDTTNAGDFEGEHTSANLNKPYVIDFDITEKEYQTPIENGYIIDVGEYWCGHNELDLYVGGLKLEPNRDWREIGAVDEMAHLIQFGIEVSNTKELIVRKMHPIIVTIENEEEEIINEVIVAEKTLSVPVDANTMVRTRPYIVNNGRIEVFKNGVKQRSGVDFFEIGEDGESSTFISFAKKLYEDDVVEVRTFNVKKEKFKDSWNGYSAWNRWHTTITPPILEDDIITIKPYIVESGMLDVYVNGYKAYKTEVYSEIGAKGAMSSQIQFLTDIFPNATVCASSYDATRVQLGKYRPKAEASKYPFVGACPEKEITLVGPIPKNTIINIPEFTAAHNEVQVFINGEKVNQPALWKEEGYRGTESNKIFFTEDVPTDAIVNIRVIHPEKKYITYVDDVINYIDIAESYINGPIAAMELITIPVYTVGSDSVVVHKNGEKLIKGTDFYEVGTIDAHSVKIRLADNLFSEDELIVRVTQPDILAYDELIDTDMPLQNIIIYDSFSRNIEVPLHYEVIIKPYMVGSNQLEVYINGEKQRRGEDYVEMGQAGNYSNQIRFLKKIEKEDELNFRIINFLNTRISDTDIIDPTDGFMNGPFLGYVHTNITHLPHEDIDVNSIQEVAEYVVGSGNIDIYIDGVKAIIGETFEEVGEIGEKSTEVKWLLDIEQYRNICIVQCAPQLLDTAYYTTILSRTVTMEEVELQLPIKAEEYIEVPKYIVGTNELRIFMSGVLLEQNVFYEEVGKEGEWSSTVKFNVDITEQYRVFVKSTTFTLGQLGTSFDLLTTYGWNRKIFIPMKYEEGVILEVPDYIVGTNRLEMYIDGLKMQESVEYSEIGEPDTISNKVKLNVCIIPIHGIEARSLDTNGKKVTNVLVGW